VPTVISSPASFTSVRNAFETRGYGAANNSLFAYRQGGGIVPSSSTFNSIGAGTSGDTLNLSQFSGFSVPDLLRFTTIYSGTSANKFNVPSRASSGSGTRPMTAYFALRTNKTCDFGGNSVSLWNPAFGDAPGLGYFQGFGPNSWGSADVTSSGYEARVNVTDNQAGGGSLVWYNVGGSSHSLTVNGYSPYITLSSNTVLEMTESGGYAYGTLEIRSIAVPSVVLSTDWYMQCEGDA
jgi:hypothetical protein